MSSTKSRDKRIAVPIQDALKEYLRESGLGTRLRYWQIYQAWSKALGIKLSKRARPVRFERGVLTVELESAAHMHELKNFTGENYRIQANKILGSERIARVEFKLKRCSQVT